ncbi:MAG: hypothetical protein ACI8Y4_002215 [Candidatus Poriferisodalaceae bacterium]|jgi:hypothetical protein
MLFSATNDPIIEQLGAVDVDSGEGIALLEAQRFVEVAIFNIVEVQSYVAVESDC